MIGNKRAIFTLGMQYLVIAIATVSIVHIADFTVIPTETTTVPTSSPTQTTLQVRPSVGDPQPVSDLIQGTRNGQQQAAGDLQTPQTADQLQPNAKLSEFPAGE